MPQISTGAHVKSGIKSNWFELGWKVHICQFLCRCFRMFACRILWRSTSYESLNSVLSFSSSVLFVVLFTFPIEVLKSFLPFLPSIPFSSACSNVSSWNVSRFQHSHNFSHLIFLYSRLVRKFWNSSIQASIHQLQYVHSYDFTRFYFTSCFQRWFSFYFWFSLLESSKNSNQCIQRKAAKQEKKSYISRKPFKFKTYIYIKLGWKIWKYKESASLSATENEWFIMFVIAVVVFVHLLGSPLPARLPFPLLSIFFIDSKIIALSPCSHLHLRHFFSCRNLTSNPCFKIPRLRNSFYFCAPCTSFIS